MDLLGDLGEEAGNQKAARREGVFGAKGRDAPALLLARLSPPLKQGRLTCIRHLPSPTATGAASSPFRYQIGDHSRPNLLLSDGGRRGVVGVMGILRQRPKNRASKITRRGTGGSHT